MGENDIKKFVTPASLYQLMKLFIQILPSTHLGS